MKFIVAVIQPHCLEPVHKALIQLGVEAMTFAEVQGYGRQKGHTEIYRGAEYHFDFQPKIQIEIAVPLDLADRAVATILASARTSEIGDGKIFVFDLEDAIRVRTGETGRPAL